jgi:hypothetical protein
MPALNWRPRGAIAEAIKVPDTFLFYFSVVGETAKWHKFVRANTA